jgi:hypothetical protein
LQMWILDVASIFVTWANVARSFANSMSQFNKHLKFVKNKKWWVFDPMFHETWASVAFEIFLSPFNQQSVCVVGKVSYMVWQLRKKFQTTNFSFCSFKNHPSQKSLFVSENNLEKYHPPPYPHSLPAVGGPTCKSQPNNGPLLTGAMAAASVPAAEPSPHPSSPFTAFRCRRPGACPSFLARL